MNEIISKIHIDGDSEIDLKQIINKYKIHVYPYNYNDYSYGYLSLIGDNILILKMEDRLIGDPSSYINADHIDNHISNLLLNRKIEILLK